MCGIGGIILGQGSSRAERLRAAQQAKTLLHRLDHRGPDDRGIISLNEQSVYLAHTRLAIIELSKSASQPMRSACGRYYLVFNGEIYNHAELREALRSDGVTVESASDTEALLYWLITHQEHGLSRLRGMFAFFFWDSQTQSGLAARDPFGIKPLYYHHDALTQRLSFASEVRALRTTLDDVQVNAIGVHGFLRLGSLPEPQTIIADVRALPAGHYALWQNGAMSERRYWPSSGNSQPQVSMIRTRAAAVAHLRTALEDTIAAHFVSDVPVGIFLSGGIDSTLLLALATQYYQSAGITQPISTFSIAFEQPEWNEGDIAALSATHFGSHHTEWVITKAQAQSMFVDYLAAIDQPSIDGFNTYCVSKLAHDHGYKVVLSGVGGDELFAGYGSFKTVPRLRQLARLSSVFWPITWLAHRVLWRQLPAKLRRITDILRKPFTHSAAYFGFRGIFSEQEALALQVALQLPANALALPTRADPILKNYELEFYLRNQLLRDSDCMSMAWGLELRVPLVDAVFYSQIEKIPLRWRQEFGKTLLIDAVPELPRWVVEQPKRGFRFPFDEWLSSDWSELELGFNWPKHIAATPWYRRWAIISLLNSIQRLDLGTPYKPIT